MNRAHPLHEQAGALQVAGSAVAKSPSACSDRPSVKGVGSMAQSVSTAWSRASTTLTGVPSAPAIVSWRSRSSAAT